jgi:hypothetical protein
MPWHLAALAVVVCIGAGAAPAQRLRPPEASVEVGRAFTIPAGGRVKLKDEPLEIGFTRVVVDSRCPNGAECITAGVAVVAMWVTHAGARMSRELRTHPAAATRLAQGPYTITLEGVEPYPQRGRRIAPRYVATFVIRRR